MAGMSWRWAILAACLVHLAVAPARAATFDELVEWCAPAEGTFHFKRQWGAEPQSLVWEYWTKSGAIDFDASPRNPRYSRAVAAWRHLPLSVTTAIGPRIVRSIPC